MELRRVIEKSLQPLARRLRTMATRGVVKLVDPSTLMQQLQVAALGDELLDRIEHWEPYGFTSNPHPEAEALLLSLGADRDHTVAVNVADRRFRLKGLASGEVAMATDEGDVIHFKRGNHIYIDSLSKITAKAPNVDVIASVKVLLDTPETEMTGNLTVAGDTDIGGNTTVAGTAVVTGALSSATSVADPTGTMQSIRITYNGHNHPENDNGGPTDAPNQQM